MYAQSDTIILALLAAGGYLLGSVSTAVIACRLLSLPDPRSTGSKNPGATNVLRTGSRKAAAMTLAGDMLKGLAAVLLARLVTVDPLALAAAGIGAFLGHLYPVFFGFRGGKGVATAIGTLLGLSWIAGLLAIITWLGMMLAFRISSLSALMTFALAPAYVWLISGIPVLAGATVLMSVLLFWRHRENIRNLINRTEHQLGKKN